MLHWKLHLLGYSDFEVFCTAYDVGLPFAAVTASTLVGRLSIKFTSVFREIFDRYFKSAFLMSDTDIRQEGLARSLHFNSS